MPTLPSGRRIEFSLDRFHGLLQRTGRREARLIAAQLNDPDDLLFVLDAVHFGVADDKPYFAGYMAADWKTCAADWKTADREAMAQWLTSEPARSARAEAIDYIKGSLGMNGAGMTYPYAVIGETFHPGVFEAPRLRQ